MPQKDKAMFEKEIDADLPPTISPFKFSKRIKPCTRCKKWPVMYKYPGDGDTPYTFMVDCECRDWGTVPVESPIEAIRLWNVMN